jgi:hypothetical protein
MLNRFLLGMERVVVHATALGSSAPFRPKPLTLIFLSLDCKDDFPCFNAPLQNPKSQKKTTTNNG